MCANIKLLEGECMNKKNQILKQEDIMNILDNCYDKCLHGIPNISPSVEKMAKDYIKKNKNKDAAWEFVKYWTGEECNKARIGMELPVLNSVVESEGIMNEDKFAPFYKMLEQSDGHTPASFIIEDWSEISENLSLSFEQLFNPSAYMDVKEVLKEAAEAQ